MTAATLPQAGEQATLGRVIPPLLGTYKRAPMEFVRGAGFYMYDTDGREYLDFTSGIGVNALGHGDPGVLKAMQSAMDTGLVHVSNLFRTGPGERRAWALTENSFADSVFFCNSGADVGA
jgi:acetylornithine/N-succinyldiaminopimelate aminotransferase